MTVTGLSLSEPVRERAKFVNALRPQDAEVFALCQQAVIDVGTALEPTDTLDALHRLQRVYLAGKLGLIDDPKISEALKDETNFPTWKDYAVLDAPEEKRDALVKAIYEGDPQNRQPILLIGGDKCRVLVEKTFDRALVDKADVDPWFNDMVFHRRLLSACDKNQAEQYADLRADYYMTAERRLEYRVNAPAVPYVDPVTNSDINTAHVNRLDKTLAPRHSSLFYTLTFPPTEEDAKAEGMAYDEFTNLFFDMCDLDWKEMEGAQKILIAKLNAGSILRFTNDDGTDVSMDITDMTFANSLVNKNVPGSEVFSAPKRDSVNGKIVAKGNFQSQMDESQTIKDITLIFEDGKVVDFDAAENRKELERYFDAHPDNSYTGEIGIGTNFMLHKHVINGLLVEKIGGSFHIALGHCYKYTEYMGEPVNLNNGNKEGSHWDITTMLFGKNGKMMLDGEVLFENDKWVDPKLSYLNGHTPN
jgi:aminopeptidase